MTLIPNPPNHTSSFRGYFGQPTAYNGDLYLRYRNNSSLFQMYWFATPYVWTGNEDSSWDNAINWDDGEVPPLVSSVKIPNTAIQPFIEGTLDVSLTSFTIEPDAKLEVKGSLKVTNRLTNNGQLTFKSDGFGTGQFDEFTGVYSGTGSVQTEQYILPRRAFRLLSPTVTTTSSINANWQEGQDNTPGFGTHITGSATGANGFDATETGNPSMYTFNNALENQSGGAGWEAVTNTDVTTLTAGTPVRLFVRGDRTIDLTDNDATATATTLRAEGDLRLGDFEPTISAFGGNFNFVTNPYQAKVDFDAISFTGDINTNFIYEWDPQLNARGGYKTTEVSMDGLGGIPVRIQVGQAFFIRNNSTVNTPPTITFTESSKDVSDDLLVLPPPPPERSAATTSSLNIELFVMNKTELLADKAQLRFSEDYTNAVTDADAGKLGNPGENLALVNSNQLLSIEQRKMPVIGEELQLLVNNYESKNYSFQIQTDNWMEEVDVYIKDNYLDELTRIDTENEFNFSVDPAISESTSILRFSLVFDNVTLSNDNFEESRIQAYPNPAQDVLYLSGITEDVSVQLFDLLGKEVLKIQKISNKQALPIESLSNGVYIVKVNGGQKSFTKKIIKN